MGKPIDITDRDFEAEVMEADSPTLVDFWAEWCPPCHIIAPILEEIADEYEGQLKVARLNVDQGLKTASRFGVMNIPTLILFDKGQSMERMVGAMPKERIKPHLTL